MDSIIDIIIPAYNAQETIRTTLDSICRQTIKDKIKVYIVDDFSNDTYNEECNDYKDKLNIKLFRLKKNGGPGHARQYGLDHSSSKYVMFIDSDDFITNDDAIEQMVNYAEENDLESVSSKINEKRNDLVSEYYVGYDTLHGKIYLRSFLEKHNIRFPNYYNSEDVAFNSLIMLYFERYGIALTNSYTYNRRDNSLTSTGDYYREKHIKCLCENIKYVVEEAKKNHAEKEMISTYLRSYFGYFFWYFRDKQDDESIKYIYDLVPYYVEYEPYFIDAGSDWIKYWIWVATDYGKQVQPFDDFIEECKKIYYKEK